MKRLLRSLLLGAILSALLCVGALAAEALAFAIEDAVKSSKMEEDKFLGLICGE